MSQHDVAGCHITCYNAYYRYVVRWDTYGTSMQLPLLALLRGKFSELKLRVHLQYRGH
jgi:hypothetical protein